LIRSDRANSFVALALAAALALGTSTLRAASEADVTLAEALFQDGKKLMSEGKYAEACPKLAESQRLDPGGGTLLALGLCHEGEGKIATAWGELNEALAVALRDKNDLRVKTARDHIATIEPKLPHVTIDVPEVDRVDGFALTLDGEPLAEAAWGAALPIDPGQHVLRAKAPKKSEWTTMIDVPLGASRSVSVAPLVDAPNEASLPTPSDDGSTKRTIGFLVGGVSLVALGLGSYFGVRAFSKRHQSNDLCPADDQCTPEGKSLNDEAKSAATASTIFFGVGIAGAAVATWLVVTSPRGASEPSDASASPTALRVTPIVGPGAAAISIGGAF